MILAKNGYLCYSVQVNTEEECAQLAHSEFDRLMKEISGAQVVSPENHVILGFSPEHGITEECLNDLGTDGFRIAIFEDTIVIAGGQRGLIYGVYAFFEKFLGVRYLTSEEWHIPKRSVVAVEACDVTEKPAFLYRHTFYNDAHNPSFAVPNRLNGDHMRSGSFNRRAAGDVIKYGVGFVHTFDKLIPDSMFEEHPEYFPMIEGERQKGMFRQRCLSNPDVLAITIEKVKEAFRADDSVRIASISQNDTAEEGFYCECPACKKVLEEEGAPSGSVIRFVNSVADAIKDEFPGRFIDTLAYRYTRKAPLKTKPRDNVIVRLCSIECCFSHTFEDCDELLPDGRVRNQTFVEDIKAWGAISKTLYIWDYIVNFLHYLTPYPNMHCLQKNMQFFAKHHVDGVFSQGCGDMAYSELCYLRAYLVAKLLWNPDCDLKEHAKEFIALYYKGAAPMVMQYLKLIYDRLEETKTHISLYTDPNPEYLTKELLEACYKCMDQAELLADDEKVLRRVGLIRINLDYAYLLLYPSEVREEREKQVDEFMAKMQKYGIKSVQEGADFEFSCRRMKAIVVK